MEVEKRALRKLGWEPEEGPTCGKKLCIIDGKRLSAGSGCGVATPVGVEPFEPI